MKIISKKERVLIVLDVVFVIVIFIFFISNYLHTNTDESPDISEQNSEQIIEDVETEEDTKIIDFQPVIDEWINTVSGNKSVIIYDLDNDRLVGSYNEEENYNIASLYKLFVVYEGYRRLQSGEWNIGEAAGSTGYTILECLDLAIRESYSPCAETLWYKIGQDELDEIIINDYKINNSDISSITSNPNDILSILKLFYSHPDISDEALITRMKDSFLNQPRTTYNWRQGLPSGFSRANVYNKVGWDYNDEAGYWNVYHDAAIIEFPEDNRHFAVIVMTEYIPYRKISDLGSLIENYFYNNN